MVESWISVMEHHSSQQRNLGQDRLEEEMVIANCGPELVNCDSIVQESLLNYFKDYQSVSDRSSHFVRRSQNVKSYTVSKSVDSLRNKIPKRPFMM